MKNNQIIIDTNNSNIAYVSKEFFKNAHIFGTPEFRMLRDFRAEMGNDIQIVAKGRIIKNRSEEQEKRKNLTYAHMVKFIESIPNNTALLEKFETMRMRSSVQSNPRRFVQDWFIETFPDYEIGIAEIVAEEQQNITRIA